MDREFGQNAHAISKLSENILFTVLGSAATLIVLQLLGQQSPSAASGPRILFFFQHGPMVSQLLVQTGLVVLTNALAMVLCETLPSRAAARPTRTTVLHAVRRGITWGVANYCAWGTFAAFAQALSVEARDLDLAVFFTSATLGGALHAPLCHIAYYYIGERLLSGYSPAELYQGRTGALLRLILPNSLTAIGVGVFFAYFSGMLPEPSVLTDVYAGRFQIALFLIVWLLFLWLFFFAVDQNSFMRRALREHNVFRIWMSVFALWLGGVLLGTELYEHVLLRTILVAA